VFLRSVLSIGLNITMLDEVLERSSLFINLFSCRDFEVFIVYHFIDGVSLENPACMLAIFVYIILLQDECIYFVSRF